MSNFPKSVVPTTLFVALLVLLLGTSQEAHAHSLLKRGGVDIVDHDESRFSLDVSLGAAGLDGFDSETRAFLTVTPRFDLRTPKGMQTFVTLPVLFIPESYATAAADPPAQNRSTFATLTNAVSPNQAPEPEFGSSVFLLPTMEWVRCTDTCYRPSLFVGVGVRHDRGSSATIPLTDAGDDAVILFGTDDVTSPALTFGSSLQRPLSPKLTFRWEARVVTTFYDDLDITTAGVESTVDLDTQVDVFVSVGLQFGF